MTGALTAAVLLVAAVASVQCILPPPPPYHDASSRSQQNNERSGWLDLHIMFRRRQGDADAESRDDSYSGSHLDIARVDDGTKWGRLHQMFHHRQGDADAESRSQQNNERFGWNGRRKREAIVELLELPENF